MMNIAAVVILYNPESIGFGAILRNLQTYQKYIRKIILVDNSQNDNSEIARILKNAEYFSNKNKGGIGGAQNVGFRVASDEGFDWVMTMDQDTYFEPEQAEAYFRLVEESVLKNESVASYSLRAENMTDISHWTDPVKNFLRPAAKKIIGIFKAEKQKENDRFFVERCIASSNIVKVSAWKKCGGFNEFLFIDQVDYDFCYRLREHGFEILKFNSVYMSQSFGEPHGFTLFRKRYAKYSRIRYYHCIRNSFIMKRLYPSQNKFYNKYIRDLFFDNCINSVNSCRNLRIFLSAWHDSKTFFAEHENASKSSETNQSVFTKYQFFEQCPHQMNAGGKAPFDVNYCAEKLGFRTIPFFFWGERGCLARIEGQIMRFVEYFILFFKVDRDSIVLMQFPYIRGGRFWRYIFLCFAKKIKGIKIITIIHDLNELRYEKTEPERKMLDCAIRYSDAIISHNDTMSDYLIKERGCSPKKLVPLGIFDYVLPKDFDGGKIVFEKSLSIAGNLDKNKCPYLKKLTELKDVCIHLYGMNYTDYNSPSIFYHGAFSPESVVQNLTHGFGLVWDGDSIETCNGRYGKYLLYNNPHKLSMYLTAGLPVVVWDKSALKNFVLSENVGIAVSSLREAVVRINQITESEYFAMHDNCQKISGRLKNGEFFEAALSKCLDRIVSSDY